MCVKTTKNQKIQTNKQKKNQKQNKKTQQFVKKRSALITFNSKEESLKAMNVMKSDNFKMFGDRNVIVKYEQTKIKNQKNKTSDKNNNTQKQKYKKQNKNNKNKTRK